MKWYFVGKKSGGYSIVQAAERPLLFAEGGQLTSIYGGYDTEEELCKEACIAPLPCKECGTIFTTSYCEPTKSEMIAKNICFSCHFWLGYVNHSRSIVVDGRHYMDCGKTHSEYSDMNGFGGRVFTYQLFGQQPKQTNNLWHQGTIPERFRERIPDNAIFL